MPVQYDNDLVRLLAALPLFSLMLIIHVGFAAANGQGELVLSKRMAEQAEYVIEEVLMLVWRPRQGC